MKKVAKYNVCKAVSTVLTVGTPIISLACCSDFFIHQPKTSISAAGMFALFISLLFLKDKIAENFKVPSAFVLSAVGLVLIIMMENIIQPMKIVCISTLVATGIDELTFKRFFKIIESKLPKSVEVYKHFGFMFCKTDDIEE